MQDVSTWRLNVMRVLYLMVFAFLSSTMWPLLVKHGSWSVMHGVAIALLGALGLLMAFGLRYPLQMLPMLLFEFLWKLFWLLSVALPLWRANQIDPETMETVVNCSFGVVVCIIAIPWKYVWVNYIRKPGERWSGRPRTMGI
jgi:hypothetical protein